MSAFFVEFQDNTAPVLRQFNILKLVYLNYNDQMPIKLITFYTVNESNNGYYTKGRDFFLNLSII